MDSSDDSFAWTNASSDSNVSEKAMDKDAEKHDEGTESGYDYKKKLHKNILNGMQEKKNKKSKKRKHEDVTSESSDYQSPSKKRIKAESEERNDNCLNAASYLNIRVKEEQKSFIEPIDLKPKKKKKHKRSLDEDDTTNTTNNRTESSTMNDTNDTIVENCVENELEKEITFEKKKKKKKKKHDITLSEDEAVVNHTVVKEKSKRKSKCLEENDNENSVISNDHNGRSFVSSTLIDNTVNESQIVENVNAIKDTIITQNKTKDNVPTPSISNRVSKISDRLTFEDDNSLNFEYTVNKGTESNISLSNHDNIQYFKNLNSHLSQSKIKYNQIESNDEEEWILSCPSDMNINDFKDLDLHLEGKSKTKIGGQIYDRMRDDNITMLTQITYYDNKPVIKNVPVKGYFRFCKRIPKVHIPDDSIMINNQTNFIPLPDTKCRHPLFGPNFKKYIKLPASVQQHLNEDNSMSVVPKSKKKKHKKEKTKVEAESELEAKLTTDSEAASSTKRKRKRKTSCKEEDSPKVSKKMKRESNSAPTWESEKAIEENLFNF